MGNLLVNPKLNTPALEMLKSAVQTHGDKSLNYFLSSGTESQKLGSLKLVGISDKSFQVAAESVVDRFKIGSSDIAFNVLPEFHVGGYSVRIRAKLAGAQIIHHENLHWDPFEFENLCLKNKVTYTSLVPTQIYDLVESNISAPPTLRLVFVGGGSLNAMLLHRALSLKWPLVLTYGMTETAAMVATSQVLAQKRDIKDSALKLLPHVKIVNENNENWIFSKSLFEHYLFVNKNEVQKIDPKINGGFKIDDLIKLDGDYLNIFGRKSELVKVKGESVSFFEIENRIKDLCLDSKLKVDFFISSDPHPRDENEIILVSNSKQIKPIVEKYNLECLPFQRIHQTKVIANIEKTDLGKIIKN